MNTYTPDGPRENGQHPNPHLQSAGTHITSATSHSAPDGVPSSPVASPIRANHKTPRNIKAVNFCWVELAAFDALDERFEGESLRTATCIYVALCRLASKQGNRADPRAYTVEIARLAKCSERTVQNYISEFEALGLIGKQEHRRGWLNNRNSYTIYAVQPTRKPLAPADDWMNLATPVDDVARVSVAAATDAASCTRNTRIKDQEKKQTNNDAAATGGGHSGQETQVEQPRVADSRLRTPADESALSETQSRAVKLLTGIGMRRLEARQLALTYSLTDIECWVQHVEAQAGDLYNPPGFVRTMLERGERPSVHDTGPRPAPKSPAGKLDVGKYLPGGKYGHIFAREDADSVSTPAPDAAAIPDPPADQVPPSNHPDKQELPDKLVAEGCTSQNTDPAVHPQPEPSWGLTGASPQGRETTSTLSPSTRDKAIWQVARERLRSSVSGAAWGMWLQHVQLVAMVGNRVMLISQAVGLAVSFERRYIDDVREVLEDLMGQEMRVEFGCEGILDA